LNKKIGINKPDIRLIIHYGLPLSIESYYQQTGRAGRDGFPSRCVLFWSQQDLTVCSNLIGNQSNNAAFKKNAGLAITSSTYNISNGNFDEQDPQQPASSTTSSSSSSTKLPTSFQRLMKMNHFVNQSSADYCRRKMILNYFQESYELVEVKQLNSFCCDLCDLRIEKLRIKEEQEFMITDPVSTNNAMNQLLLSPNEISKEVYMILSVIFDIRGFYGLGVVISLLHGKNDKTVQRIPSYSEIDYFGKGTIHSVDWWKELTNQLVEKDGFLEKVIVRHGNGYSFMKYQLTRKGILYLTGVTLPPGNDSSNDNGNHGINYFALKKIPFNVYYHLYKTAFSEEFTKIYSAELKVKELNKDRKSCYTYHPPMYVPIIDPRKGNLEKKKSNNGFYSDKSTENNTNIVNYVLTKEKRELEAILRDIRKLIATELGITPYQLLTSIEIFSLMDILLFETPPQQSSSSVLPLQDEKEFMHALKWPEWKRNHAELIMKKLKLMNVIKKSKQNIESIEGKEDNDEIDEHFESGRNKNDGMEPSDQEKVMEIIENNRTKSLYRPNYDPLQSQRVTSSSTALYRPSYSEQPVIMKNNSSLDEDDDENNDGNDSDATCEQRSPVMRTKQVNIQCEEIISIFDDGHLRGDPVTKEEEEQDAADDDENMKENTLNRSSSSISSSTAALKAQRKRHFLAGFGGEELFSVFVFCF
jgi:superfamily II DNA helicase RecQ